MTGLRKHTVLRFTRFVAPVAFVLLVAVARGRSSDIDSRDHKPHWSFVAPRRPALPSTKNLRWARNAVDQARSDFAARVLPALRVLQ
jgi:hypothetical protein